MPLVSVNGIRMSYERSGRGTSVLLIMGSAAAGRVWTMYQTPALERAGYECVTFDHRGVPPTDVPPGRYAFADMVADVKGLIEACGLGPCRIVGTSLGAMIAQELAVAHPELVHSAVLLGTRARSDALRTAYDLANQQLAESGTRLPAGYEAVVSALQMLSPATWNDEVSIARWLDLFELSSPSGVGAGQVWAEPPGDRRAALGRVAAPCRVIAFEDDMVTPPHLCAEVADAIPDCDLVRIPAAGHLGYLERPDEVNTAIVEFLDRH
jgi:pimeloyl-ACP methyl ester carboxylesterase